jgi:Mce-associated membrane protein
MTVDNEAVEEAKQEKPRRGRGGMIGRWMRGGLARCLARWRPILLTILLIASTGFCAGYFFFVYRTDLQTDDAVAHEVIKVASDGAVALLSYSPGSLTQDFNNAKSLVTEDYLAYYQQFAERIVGPAAMRGGVTTTATVIRAAVAELHPNSAVVLLFLKQKIASKEKPQPVVTSSKIEVSLTKVNGNWLIDKFNAADPEPRR